MLVKQQVIPDLQAPPVCTYQPANLTLELTEEGEMQPAVQSHMYNGSLNLQTPFRFELESNVNYVLNITVTTLMQNASKSVEFSELVSSSFIFKV